MTLHSSYTGTGQPVNTLTVTASNTTSGEGATSAAKTITVTDPPIGTTGSSSVDPTPPVDGAGPQSLSGFWNEQGALASHWGPSPSESLSQYLKEQDVLLAKGGTPLPGLGAPTGASPDPILQLIGAMSAFRADQPGFDAATLPQPQHDPATGLLAPPVH